MRDIGQMFSDKNKKFKNMRSTILLQQVINKLYKKIVVISDVIVPGANLIDPIPKHVTIK